MDSETADDADSERRLEIVKSHAVQLMEHFDSVQIVCTRHDPYDGDGTLVVNWGEGNWYARYGAVKQWVKKSEET